MAIVTGLTSARMLEIENASVVNGFIDELGHLILITKGGSQIDAGPITTFIGTTDAAGGVELATSSETQAGVDAERAVTPAGLFSVLNTMQGFRYKETIQYKTSGTFLKANYPSLKAVRVRVVGGGGGGGYAGSTDFGNHSCGGGGGGGGYKETVIQAADIPTSVNVTIGAGGAGGTTSSNAGGIGGTSSFGPLVGATGGEGGNSVINQSLMIGAAGGWGGSGTVVGLDGIMVTGGPGQIGTGYASLGIGGAGGNSALGGGGAGSSSPSGSFSLSGNAGGIYGGGGAGAMANQTATSKNGGAGAPGIVIVEVYT